jgi:hypothetical protein
MRTCQESRTPTEHRGSLSRNDYEAPVNENGRAAGFRYTWGDSVRVKDNAPATYRPASSAEVVGLRSIETSAEAAAAAEQLGARLYVIEYLDGSSIELEESWLEPLSEG